jgi:hypothetical protein
MFAPESIPGWNVEEEDDSVTGLGSLGGDVIVPEPPDPLVEPDPLVDPEPVVEPEPLLEPDPLVEPEPADEPEPPEGLVPEPLDGGLVLVEEPGAGAMALRERRRRAVAVLPTSVR